MGAIKRLILKALGYQEIEPKDALEELKSTLHRALSVTKYQVEVRQLCVDAVKMIDEFGVFDVALEEESPVTRRTLT